MNPRARLTYIGCHIAYNADGTSTTYLEATATLYDADAGRVLGPAPAPAGTLDAQPYRDGARAQISALAPALELAWGVPLDAVPPAAPAP